MDQRGKMLLGYTDVELANLGGYDLVHYDDLAYVASAHQECKFKSFGEDASYYSFHVQKTCIKSFRIIYDCSIKNGSIWNDSI